MRIIHSFREQPNYRHGRIVGIELVCRRCGEKARLKGRIAARRALEVLENPREAATSELLEALSFGNQRVAAQNRAGWSCENSNRSGAKHFLREAELRRMIVVARGELATRPAQQCQGG